MAEGKFVFEMYPDIDTLQKSYEILMGRLSDIEPWEDWVSITKIRLANLDKPLIDIIGPEHRTGFLLESVRTWIKINYPKTHTNFAKLPYNFIDSIIPYFSNPDFLKLTLRQILEQYVNNFLNKE